MKRLGWRRTAIYSMLPLLFLAIVVEVAARFIEPALPAIMVDVGLGFSSDSRVFTPDALAPAYLETAPEKRLNFIHQRFLKSKPLNHYRVFFIGESSVYNMHPGMFLLRYRLEVALRGRFEVEVINCGGLPMVHTA